MLKSISNIDGVKLLAKSSQKRITGGFDDFEFGECATLNSFFCGVIDHICCNGLCVLPSNPVCNLV